MNKHETDLKGLQYFENETDREESPIFVGRERETEHVLGQAEVVGKAHAEGRATQGATIVITGCPGSGKSAFLGHLAGRSAKVDRTNTVIIPVRCSHLDLTARNSEELQAQLANFAIKRKQELLDTLQAVLKDAGEALKLPNTLQRLEQKISKGAGKRTVVCLLVDEIQGVTEESAAAVQLLHTHAFSPPVLPIYAGLDDSMDRLQRTGRISRLSANAHMTMGALREGCATAATEQLFEMYGVRSDARTRSAWAQAIEEESLGFAQHLHVALQGACRVLIDAQGIARAEDAAEVKRRARAGRERFYASKMRNIARVHRLPVLDVVHQATRTNTPLTESHLAKWAKEAMDRHDPLSIEHGNDEAHALVERMRHQGILHLSAQDRAQVPIPSLREWLTGPYAQEMGWQPPADPGGRAKRRGQSRK